jgi:hypothetical protein
MAEKNPIAQLFEQKTTVTKEKNTDGIGRLFVQNSAQDITNNFEPAKASAKKIFETGWNDANTMQSAVDMWNKLATSAEIIGQIDPAFAETAKNYRETANALAKLQGTYKNYSSAKAYNQAVTENEKAVAESKKAIDDIVNFDANKVRHTIDQLEKVYNDALPLDNPSGYEGWTPQKYWIYNKSYGIVPGVTFNNAESLKAYIDNLKASIAQNKKDKELLGYAELIDKTNVVETKDFANKLQNNEYMTEEQRETYNKLYKIDKEKADKYWNLIQETVNYAKALKTYEKIDDSDFLKILYSVPANLDRFGTGLVNTFKPNDSYYAPSAVSITGNMARQDLQGTFGGALYDALGTVAYVAPIIAVSYLSKGVGAKLLASKKASTAVKTFGQILVDNAGAVGRTAMGASVYGNSYAEMINSGYNVTQAKAYGTLTAISEVLLTDLLSGIAGIGGSKLTANAIKNADSALMQFAIRHGGEAVEEGLQTVLESVFKSAITGEIHEADIGEVLYSALLGFASSASLSGVGTGALKTVDATKSVISKIKANANSVNKTKQTNELIDYALKFPEGAVSREIATMIKGGNGAYTVAEYLHDRNWQMNERDVQNFTDELISRGFMPENAMVVADAIGKVTNGVELTEDQQNALNKDTVTASALLDGAVQRDSHDYGTQAEYQKIVEIPAEETSVQTEQFPIEQQAEQTPTKETIQMPQETAKTDGKIIEGKTISTKDSGTLNKLGKVLNRKIRVVDSLIKNGKQVNGYFNNETGEIVLNAKAKNAWKVVLKHELTHSLEKLTNYYDFFNKVADSKVFKNWLNEQGHTLETLRKETIDTRQNAKDENFADTKSIEELQLAAEQEILADFIGDMLYAEDGGIEQMLEDLSPKQKRSFIEWIRDVIRNLINKVKGVDTSLENELRALEKQFAKMLNETTKNEKNTGEGVKSSVNDVKLSISKDQKRETLEMLKNGQITTEEAMKRLDNTKEKPLKELKDVVDLTKDRVVTRVTEKKRNQAEKKDKESRFAENLDKSKWFDKEFKDEARNDNFIQTYAGITNKETLQQAVAELDEGGQERVSKWIRTPAEQATLIDEAIGFILLERAKLNGDLDAQLTIAQKLREYATSGGRKVQLFSIMGRLTPEGMMLYAQTELDQALKAMQERRTKRWLDEHEGKFKLTEADKEYITRRVRQASTLPEGSRAKDILLAEISTRIQNKLPVKSGQSLKALQRISMLLNVKTNIRNVASNALSMGQFQLADLFGTGIDALTTKYVQSKGFDAQRTTGFGNVKENIKAFGRGAYNSYDDFRRRINTRGIEQNRYEIGEGLSFDTNTKNKLLNTVAQRFNELDRLTSFLLDFGDRPFYEMWFTNSLNAQMRLNRVDTPTVEMIEIATEEALQRTWQDSNKLTKAANSAKDFLNKFNFNMVMPFAADYGLGDVFIKFTKTPANLAKAIFDFSPVGLTRSIIFDAKEFNESLKKGKYDIKKQKKFVNNLSKGVAGTIIQLAISALASAGILSLTGKNDDDDDVRAFENYVKGMPQYSIKIGDTYITYDWAQPLGAYLATVADYMQEKEANPNNSDFETLLTALSSGGNVLMQQSFLYSLQNLFSSFKGSEGVFTNVIASLFDDPSVYIPQILSQIAELTDDKRRVTYSEDGFERMINKIKVKIPGLRQTLEAERNVLGEEAENPRNDVFNAFFNPGNVYSKVDNEVVDEVYALYKATGEKKAILPKADSSVSANGVNYRYSIEEKANVQKVMGQTAVSIIDEAMNLKDYENLTDQQKVEFLTKVYSYSKAKAKSDIVYSYDFLHAIYGDVLTQDKYNNLSDKQKKMLADAHFLSAYSEVKEGEEAEYFIKKVEDSTKNKTKSNAKEQKANSKTIDTIIKNK